MAAYLLLLLVNLGFTLLHKLADLQSKSPVKRSKEDKRPLLARIMTVENLHFGGVQMSTGKWWTIITATFEHAGYSHLVNNMVHFLGFAYALEAVIGKVELIFHPQTTMLMRARAHA